MDEQAHLPTLAPNGSTPEDLGRQLLRQRMFPAQTRPSKLGRYMVIDFIGAGGMGQVFAAYDPELDRKVAIKLLSPSLAGASTGAFRLLREAQAMAKLSHPNVVQIYEVGELDGQVFLAMEFVAGQTLRAWLERSEVLPTEDEVLDAFLQAGRGLAAAHAAGLVHRDFKPDNVLMDEQGRARVLDFGLVAATDDEPSEDELAPIKIEDEDDSSALDQRLTATGALLGTPRYMSPEQFRGQALDGRSDQFSFCVALYEALCGAPPFAGSNVVSLMANVLHGRRYESAEVRPLPRRLRAAIERGLSPDPSDRWPSMDALLDALAPPSRQRQLLGAALVGLPLLALCGWQLVDYYEQKLDARTEQLAVASAKGAEQSQRAERASEEAEAIARLRAAERVELLARSPGRELEAIAGAVELVAPDPDAAPDAALRGLNLALLGRVPLASLDRSERLVARASFTPDGSRLVTTPQESGEGAQLELWSTQPPRLERSISLEGLELDGRAPAISPDGRHVAVSSHDRCLVFEFESGERSVGIAGCTAPMWSVDGNSLFGEQPCQVQDETQAPSPTCAVAAWDIDGTMRWGHPLRGRDGQLIVHPEGELLVLRQDASAGGIIELLRTDSGEREALLERDAKSLRKPEPMRDPHMALSADGRKLAVIETHDGGRALLWDLDTRSAQVTGVAKPSGWGWGFAGVELSADGEELLLTGRGGGLSIYDLKYERYDYAQTWGSSAAALTPHSWLAVSEGEWFELPQRRPDQAAPKVNELIVSADAELGVTLSGTGARLWDLGSPLVDTWPYPDLDKQQVEGFDREVLVTRHFSGELRVFPREPGGGFASEPSIVDTHHGRLQPQTVASERPRRVVFGSTDGPGVGAAVYEIGEPAALCALPDGASAWRLDPSGSLVAGVFEQQLRVLEVEGCRERERVELPRSGLWLHALTREGAALLRGELGYSFVFGEGRGQVIDAGCREQGPIYAQLAPSGRVLLTNCNGERPEHEPGRLWDTSSGELLREFDLRGYNGVAQFTPDESGILLRSGRHSYAVVELESGRERLRLPGRLPMHPRWSPRGDAHQLEYFDARLGFVRVPLSAEGLLAAGCEVLGNSELAGEEQASAGCGTDL